MASTSSSQFSKTSPESSNATSSPTAEESSRTGRPNKWTVSRQRKLARLYLYSILPPKDICEALKEKHEDPKHNWEPGKDSATKTVNSLLDNDPRWLRPKTRGEMDERILRLSERKKTRKLGRKVSSKHSPNPSVGNNEATGTSEVDAHEALPLASTSADATLYDGQRSDRLLFADFSETPIQDLLALFPPTSDTVVTNAVPTTSLLNALFFHSFISPGPSPDFLEESVLPSSHWSVPADFNLSGSPSIRTTTGLSVIDDVSVLTEFSTSSLKRRLSQYSTLCLKAVARLLKAHSVTNTSNCSDSLATGPTSTVSLTVDGGSAAETHTLRRPSISASQVRPRVKKVVLPNALLLLDRHIRRQGICLAGLKRHDLRLCWCLEELELETQLWVGRHGLVNPHVKDPPTKLNLNLEFCDVFGNNVLHMLAARAAEIFLIVEALEQGIDGNAKNLAEQSFLHLLPRRFLRLLASPDGGLLWFLQTLNKFNIRFHDCDIFGRSFFHLLTREAKAVSPNSLHILGYLNIQLSRTHDAFDWVSSVEAQGLPEASGRTYGTSTSYRTPYHGEFDDTRYLNLPTIPEDCGETHSHARMLETARISEDVPTIRDSEGRNGLQCLAEVSLCLDPHLPGLAKYSSKRKRGQIDPNTVPTSMRFRYEVAQGMIEAGVDVNNYDSHGNNVLMAFVAHRADGEDDKTLASVLTLLIESGANVRRRNRHGETALHVAVRLGRKVATRVLLANGAHVHARTAEEKGVLAVGEAHYIKAREDPPLYASIFACMALCIKAGAVAAPTLVQEWQVRKSVLL